MCMIHETSCGAIIFRLEQGKQLFLLLHYTEGHWDFPKGHVQAGEAERQTARREIAEETGITELEFIGEFREVISYYYTFEGKKCHKTAVFFLAKTVQEKITLSFEHQNCAWLPYEEAVQKATYESAKELLKNAHRFLGNTLLSRS